MSIELCKSNFWFAEFGGDQSVLSAVVLHCLLSISTAAAVLYKQWTDQGSADFTDLQIILQKCWYVLPNLSKGIPLEYRKFAEWSAEVPGDLASTHT